jgi:lipopolysaccharide transport system permease protein
MSPLKQSPVKDREEAPNGNGHGDGERKGNGNGSRAERRTARSSTTVTTSHTGIKLSEYGEYKELFYNLTLRELRSKYKRSVIGWGWSMINPLANMAVYTIVFAVLLEIHPPVGVPSRLDNYALMLLAAMLPWNFFQGSIMESMGALLGNQNLIQKTYFPREMIPGATVASKMVSHLIEMGLLLVVILGFGNWRALIYIPLVILTMAVIAAFALGLSLLFSIGNVFYRDIQHFSNIFFFIWMFLTPIAYPYYILAGGLNSPTGSLASPKIVHLLGHAFNLGSLFKINPMTDAVLVFQSFMYDGALPGSTYVAKFANTVPVPAATVNGKLVAAHNVVDYTRLVIHSAVSWVDFGYLIVWAVVSLVVGLWVFRKYEARLPEEL